MEEGQHEISIKNLNKLKILELLWENIEPASFFVGRMPAPGFNNELARIAVTKGYIDYFCGRAIKCDLSKDTVNTRLYDRDVVVKFKELIKNL